MSKPGLIIGLGNVGQQVLTWLKRDLLLSNDGAMPKNVRLLEIDTCTHLEADISPEPSNSNEEGSQKVDNVMLEKGEYIYIGGNAHSWVEKITGQQDTFAEKASHWFYAIGLLSVQELLAQAKCAGQFRQLGRLAIFYDVRRKAHIRLALQTAIESISSTVSKEHSLEILVVGSLASGTGSGILTDVACILRRLAQQLNVQHILRGLFTLPGIFTTPPDAEMKARSFAALRGLNRFMMPDTDFPMPEIGYIPTNLNSHARPTQQLFDFCYLVDSKTKERPTVQDEHDVFETLAQVLSVILNEEADIAYSQAGIIDIAENITLRCVIAKDSEAIEDTLL